jgi:hypothetical protein
LAPGSLSAPDVPINRHGRVCAAEQFSNILSVTDLVDNKLLGVIKLGDAQPANFGKPPTCVSLFDQGLIQVLQASVTGLEPKQKYVLALANHVYGGGPLQPLAAFMANPAGSPVVNATGPIRQMPTSERRYLDCPRRCNDLWRGGTGASRVMVN